MIDSVLKGYMNETKHEFLIKPSPFHPLNEIQQYINNNFKNEKGKMLSGQKALSDFDII